MIGDRTRLNEDPTELFTSKKYINGTRPEGRLADRESIEARTFFFAENLEDFGAAVKKDRARERP